MRDRTTFARPRLCLALFVVCACSLEGCSVTLYWDVVVDVTDVNGQPLQNACIVFRHSASPNAYGRSKWRPKVIPRMQQLTNRLGRAEFTIEAGNISLDDHPATWDIIITKEGFETISLDISPDVDGRHGPGPWPVRVRAFLRGSSKEQDDPLPTNTKTTDR